MNQKNNGLPIFVRENLRIIKNLHRKRLRITPKKTSTPEINSEINSTEIEVKASNERKRGRAELREELSKKQKIAADLEREVIELRDKKKKLELETFYVKTNTEEKSKCDGKPPGNNAAYM